MRNDADGLEASNTPRLLSLATAVDPIPLLLLPFMQADEEQEEPAIVVRKGAVLAELEGR